jgi:hypothetical protein
MPFALLLIGLVLLIAGVKNTQDTLFSTVKGDFTGQDNFIYWFVAIIIIGSLGYIPKLKPISTAFLALVIVVLFLKKGSTTGLGGGFFSQFTSALGSTDSGTGSSTQDQLSALKNQQVNLLGQLSQNLSQSSEALAKDIEQ